MSHLESGIYSFTLQQSSRNGVGGGACAFRSTRPLFFVADGHSRVIGTIVLMPALAHSAETVPHPTRSIMAAPNAAPNSSAARDASCVSSPIGKTQITVHPPSLRPHCNHCYQWQWRAHLTIGQKPFAISMPAQAAQAMTQTEVENTLSNSHAAHVQPSVRMVLAHVVIAAAIGACCALLTMRLTPDSSGGCLRQPAVAPSSDTRLSECCIGFG